MTMSKILPIDDESRSVGSRARAIVHYKFDSNHWEYREKTGVDVGIDCIFELTENDQWTGNIIECQIKGRTQPKYNTTHEFISLSVKVSTVNYWLKRKNPVVLLVVDVTDETIYYLDIKAYFRDKGKQEQLAENQNDITLRVPVSNIVSTDDEDLQQIARFH